MADVQVHASTSPRAMRRDPDPVQEVLDYGQLLLSLTWRDLRVRYKQSLLGVAWAILLPMSMMLIFTFVFTRAVQVVGGLKLDMPYALFAYAGLVPWTFFSMSISTSVNSLVANRNLVTKVYFPREVFPLSCILSCFADFVIASSVLAGLIAYFHYGGDWTFKPTAALFFLPIVIAVQLAFTVGLAMVLAMANLFYRDVRQIVSVALQLWLFISCVVVPVPTDGTLLAKLIALNPMVPIISAYRDCLFLGQLPEGGPYAYAATVALLTLIGGWYCFRRASFRFAECI
jgi:lipopolysaccharide transport system permease protein